jgi:hypothetical protein
MPSFFFQQREKQAQRPVQMIFDICGDDALDPMLPTGP